MLVSKNVITIIINGWFLRRLYAIKSHVLYRVIIKRKILVNNRIIVKNLFTGIFFIRRMLPIPIIDPNIPINLLNGKYIAKTFAEIHQRISQFPNINLSGLRDCGDMAIRMHHNPVA